MRPWTTVLALGLVLAGPGRGSAHQPPHEEADLGEAVVAIAPWLSLGAALRHEEGSQTDAAVDVAFDLGITFPILNTDPGPVDSRIRLGPWFQVRTGSFQTLDLGVGARFFFAGRQVDWFKAEGRWGFYLDGGISHAWRRATRTWPRRQLNVVGRLAWGYRTVWPQPETHYFYEQRRIAPPVGIERGLRVVATLRRSVDGPAFWEASLGLEVELSGAAVWLASLF